MQQWPATVGMKHGHVQQQQRTTSACMKLLQVGVVSCSCCRVAVLQLLGYGGWSITRPRWSCMALQHGKRREPGFNLSGCSGCGQFLHLRFCTFALLPASLLSYRRQTSIRACQCLVYADILPHRPCRQHKVPCRCTQHQAAAGMGMGTHCCEEVCQPAATASAGACPA